MKQKSRFSGKDPVKKVERRKRSFSVKTYQSQIRILSPGFMI